MPPRSPKCKSILKKFFFVQTAYFFTRKRSKLHSEIFSDSGGKFNLRNNKHIKILVWIFVLFVAERTTWCVCVCMCVRLCVLTTCWMTRQPSDRSSDRVTARWQPPRASSGKPFETGSHPSTDTKTAGMAVDEASSKSSGWKLDQRCGMTNCASKYLANINEIRPGAPSCKLSSVNEIQLC